MSEELKTKLDTFVIKPLVLIMVFAFLLFFQYGFGMMCFDQCPSNSEIIMSTVLLTSFLISTGIVWWFYKNKVFRIIVTLLLLGWHILFLLTSTAGFG